ncbi:MAG: Hsp20/alpha crystallin family protein [Spirochaetales bacterium]|nr:Hsp20/alpha crystallin family protein [Spirochaetales bacterium]
MSSTFNINETLEDLVRELNSGAREFARVMAEEAKAHGYAESCSAPGSFDLGFENLVYPRCDSFNNDEGSLVFRFQLPGFDESGINLSFKGDAMVLTAKAPAQGSTGFAGSQKPFIKDVNRREYRVPADQYDQAAAKAVYKSGILTVTIPPAANAVDAIKVEIVKEGD